MLSQGPPENFCRPAVDPLFRSAVAAYDGAVLAVVLTGMGADGRAGASAVRDAGGTVVVQDQATSVVWGMPGAVASAGLADEILPLDRIAETIESRMEMRRLISSETSSTRMSVKLIFVCFVIIMAIVCLPSETAMHFYTQEPAGWICLGAALGLMVAGTLVINKMADIPLD